MKKSSFLISDFQQIIESIRVSGICFAWIKGVLCVVSRGRNFEPKGGELGSKFPRFFLVHYKFWERTYVSDEKPDFFFLNERI